MKLWGHRVNNQKRSAKTGLYKIPVPILKSLLFLTSLLYGTASGCKMNSFGIEYSQRLAREFSWLAATAVGYSFHAAGHALVVGQDETQWNIKLQIYLNLSAEVLAGSVIALGWQAALCRGKKDWNKALGWMQIWWSLNMTSVGIVKSLM